MMPKLVAAASITLATVTFAAPTTKHSSEEKKSKDWQEPLTGMLFRAIPKGCFKMGAATPQVPQPEVFWDRIGYTKTASEDEKPLHEVCVDAFWLGKYEVLSSEWQLVMGRVPPGSDTLPVTGITWDQAEEFARRLTKLSSGKFQFRLPTEAEWEYACRAGSTQDIEPFANGADAYAWYQFKRAETQPVGQLQPNAFGLHDMLGNVWEWVADSYTINGYARHDLYNPRVTAMSGEKVIRGGSFRTERVQIRCAMRGHHPSQAGMDSVGVRLVRQ